MRLSLLGTMFDSTGAPYNWIIGAVMFLFWPILALLAAGAEPNEFRTGADLRRQLESKSGLEWGGVALRSGLTRLATAHRVAIFLDRRVDPDQKIDLKLQDVSLEALLESVAQKAGGKSALVGSVLYIGPTRATGLLPTVAALRRNELSTVAKKQVKLNRVEASAWLDATEPAKLLEEMLTAYDLKLSAATSLPHDLWSAGELPPLPMADRLSIFLAGFDLTFAFAPSSAEGSAGTIKLVQFPTSAAYEQTYKPAVDIAKALVDLKQQYPQAKFRREGAKIVVTSGEEEQVQIARLLAGESVKTTKVTTGEKRYTVTVERQPAGAVLKKMAQESGRELKYDAALLAKLKQEVSFSVKDVSAADLLKKTLEPLGLKAVLGDGVLEVVEAEAR